MKTDRAVKIAYARWLREIGKNLPNSVDMYLLGYRTAIQDFLWDYARLVIGKDDMLIDTETDKQVKIDDRKGTKR